MSTEIVKLDPKEFGLEESKASQIAEQFKPMLDKMVELEKEYNEIIQKEINEETCKAAKALRLKYVKVRTGTAEIHKEQKAFYLAGGRFVDGWKNAQLFASQGIEEKLENIEKYYERQEQERINKLREDRTELLAPYGVDTSSIGLGTMTEEVWQNYFTGVKLAHDAKIKAEQEAEAARIEQERKERVYRERVNELAPYKQFMQEGEGISVESSDEDCSVLLHSLIQRKAEYEAEQERIRIENEKLKKQAEEAEAKAKKEREEAARKQRELEETARKEKEAIEAKARADKEEADRKAAEAQKETDRLAKELADKKDAEEKAERERLAAIKKAAAAPDKDKLLALKKQIDEFVLPELSTDDGKQVISDVKGLLVKVSAFIESKSNNL